jgi:spoIIIJ-associated protein
MAIKEIIATGKDVAEAKENARATLGVGELDNVQFEVLNLGSRGIFGIIGVKPAQVRAFIEIPDAPQRQRHDKKKNHRPENATNIGANENKEASGEAKPQNNHKKKKKKPAHHEGAPKGESKPKSEVIPECELKFELREVEDGVDMSFDFIKTLISDIGLEAEAKLYSCDDGTRRITISGNDASTLIGHHGDTLDALQYLANLASARKNRDGERDKSRVTLDIEGYRAKREETLRALARRMAAKAIRNNRSVMLEPMSAYERRIIHSEIQGIEGVCTNSIGSDNNRKIVIYLTEKKPEGIFEEEKDEEEEEIISTSEAVETVTTSDLEEASETVAVEITHPDENEDSFAPGEDEDDIK